VELATLTDSKYTLRCFLTGKISTIWIVNVSMRVDEVSQVELRHI